ncbi:MAG TPA: type II secretion system protein [Polyangiaceae bacterium]|nr:type II secretion system protein [Polyangiaceae bacterium]
MALRHWAKKRKNRGKSHGFTLVELLTVVAITGILATIGTMMVRKHFAEAKTAEAVAIIQSIRAAQESRRAETGTYQSCSFTAGTPWYPADPDGLYRAWKNPSHPDWDAWKELSVVARPEGTQFGFLVRAGSGPKTLDTTGAIVDSLIPAALTSDKPTWTTPNDQWFVIQAAGDRDKDGVLSRLLAASFNGELYTENDAE